MSALSALMSTQQGNQTNRQTFQSSAALVKLTGVCDTFSDSSVEEDAQSPHPHTEDPPTPGENDDDSPTWATTSWKSDSGFNSDIGCSANFLEQENQDSRMLDWRENSLDSPDLDEKETDYTTVSGNSHQNIDRDLSHEKHDPDMASVDTITQSSPAFVPVINSFHCQTEITQGQNGRDFPNEKPEGEVVHTICNGSAIPSTRPDGIQSEHSISLDKNHINSTDNQLETLDRISDRLTIAEPNGGFATGNHERTNPFHRIPLIDDNHFEVASVIKVSAVEELKREPLPPVASLPKDLHQQPSPPVSKASGGSTADEDKELMDDEFELWEQNVLEMITESLSVEEDYFSQPEGFFGYSRYEELEQAIQKYKQKVMSTPEDSEKRQGLVKKLVQLRLKLQELKDEPEADENDKRKKVLGHQFVICNGQKMQPNKCDVCANSMWSRLKAGYLCRECGFACHSKCIDVVKRHCVAAKLSKKASYEMAICPEVGLAAQNYRCADCKVNISFKNDSNEPRQCDYTGLYYCQICHWNDAEVIPARAVHNWDFLPRKICRQSKQLLDLMQTRVVVNLDSLNPGLFNRVEALTNIKKLREDILVMKLYFVSCKYAKEARLLRLLEERLHFVEGSSSYTIQDLAETHADTLYESIKEIHKIYSQHIRIECDLCRAKGFICELCRAEELIFPFDIIAITCSKCSAVFHRDCFFKKKGVCPKCERLQHQDHMPDDHRDICPLCRYCLHTKEKSNKATPRTVSLSNSK